MRQKTRQLEPISFDLVTSLNASFIGLELGPWTSNGNLLVRLRFPSCLLDYIKSGMLVVSSLEYKFKFARNTSTYVKKQPQRPPSASN